MKSSQQTHAIADADLKRHHGEVLKGQFVDVLRSNKGKLKGIVLRTADQTYDVKLPKYLRPVLVRELAPHAFVKVWAYPDDGRWRGINIMPLEEPEAIALRDVLSHQTVTDAAVTVPPPKTVRQPQQMCVQVCRKGTCAKRGGKQLLDALRSEVATNPDLQHVSVEGVGCMKACKKGPNIKLSNSKKVITGISAEKALDLIGRNP